jgi:uncharacterized phage-like protein YoqJ
MTTSCYQPLTEFDFVLSATGHRPPKLMSYPECYSDEFGKKLTQFAIVHISRLTPDAVISGMALGWDLAIARASIQLKIPLIAAVPFKGQESAWKDAKTKRLYHTILDRAHQVVIVSPGGYSAQKMQVRNEWMVQNSHLVLALWDRSKGGTGNCIEYARQHQCGILNVWQHWARA